MNYIYKYARALYVTGGKEIEIFHGPYMFLRRRERFSSRPGEWGIKEGAFKTGQRREKSAERGACF